MVMRALLYRGLVIVLWSLLLAVIVSVVRKANVIKEEADDVVEPA
jgi:hypothetical protein